MPGGWHGYLQGDAAFCATGPSTVKGTLSHSHLVDELNCKEQRKTHWQINPIRNFNEQETLDFKKSAVKQTSLAKKGKRSFNWVSTTRRGCRDGAATLIGYHLQIKVSQLF